MGAITPPPDLSLVVLTCRRRSDGALLCQHIYDPTVCPVAYEQLSHVPPFGIVGDFDMTMEPWVPTSAEAQ